MPEVLLNEAVDSDTLTVTLGVVDGLRSLFVQQVRALVQLMPGLHAQVELRWQEITRSVSQGQTDAVHRCRSDFARLVDSRLSQLRQALRLADMASVVGETECPGNKELPVLIQNLERFRSKIIAAWNSEADLEELAAAEFPLSAPHLKELVGKYPPPAQWYEEDVKPF